MSRQVWLLLLLLAFTVRCLAAIGWQHRVPAGRMFIFPDSEGYWALGRALAEGEAYQYGGPDARVFRTPGYPVVLAAVIALFGTDRTAVMVARFVGAALGALSVGLTAWWYQTLFGPRGTALAALMAALYPGAIVMSIVILSEAAFCPLMLLQLVCWARGEQAAGRASWGWAMASGVAAGAATLCRPSWLLFLPVAGVASLLWPGTRKRRAIQWGWMMLGLVLVMLPWWYRNYQVVGRFVPTTLQVGASLYDGWNPRATGASQMDFVAEFERQLRNERRWKGDRDDMPFEVELDRRMRDAALQWANSHPLRVLQLAGLKFLRMWNVCPNDAQFQSRLVCWGMAGMYLPVLFGGVLGLYRAGWRHWPVALCLAPSVYLTMLHVVFVGSIRYREPAMFGWIVLAASCLVPCLRGNSSHERTPATAAREQPSADC